MLSLRIFLDGPMLEVFANDRLCLTQQVFPSSMDAVGIAVFANGGRASLLSCHAWDMASATFTDERAVVPEPGTCVMFLTGVIGWNVRVWKNKRSRACEIQETCSCEELPIR
jgi:hypothetical protein